MQNSSTSKNVIIISIAILFSGLAIFLFMDVLVLLFLSVLVALILDPAVSFFEHKFKSRNLAAILVFLLLGVFVYIFSSQFVPAFLSQLSELTKKLSQDDIKESIRSIETGVRKVFALIPQDFLIKQYEKFILSINLNEAIPKLGEFISGVLSYMVIMVIVPFMSYFIVKDRTRIIKGLLGLLPNKYFEMSYWVSKKITMQLGRYVRGWLLDAAFVGLACWVAFSLLGIKNSAALGIIAGIGHLVPYFGPVIGGIPAFLILLIQNQGDLSFLPFLLISLAIIYILDNGIVQPYVFSKSVDMHPLLIILLILAGNSLLGVWGMLFAVPAATVVKTAVSEIYSGYKNYNLSKS